MLTKFAVSFMEGGWMNTLLHLKARTSIFFGWLVIISTWMGLIKPHGWALGTASGLVLGNMFLIGYLAHAEKQDKSAR